jgi:putative DNA primase/helicase
MRLTLPPTVNADNPDLRVLTEKTWEAIGQVNDPPNLFRCEGDLALVAAAGSGETPRIIRPVNTHELLWFLTKYIDFITSQGKPKRPPNDLLQILIATPNKPLLPLDGIVEAPVFAPDGTIHLTAGYDPTTRLYYARPKQLQSLNIPGDPGREQVRQAVELLEDLIGDFPFVGESSKAHAIAALLLPFVRPMIDGPTPLHLIYKPKPGTGGTLLASTLSIPAGLRQGAVMHLPDNESERRRALLGILNSQPVSVILDNVKRLEGEALACCLTQEYYQDRIIGSSNMGRVRNRCLWLATGNNPTYSDEIARRTIPIYLDAKSEHPDLGRVFKHPDLLRWATENRPKLVQAALTIVQAWIAIGRPAGTRTLGGFESWSHVMGGILENAGVDGFLGNIIEHRAKGDRETVAFSGFVDSWAQVFRDQRVPASKLVPLAESLDLGSGRNGSASIRLGKLLSDREGQRFGNWIIKRDSVLSGTQQWRLEPAKEDQGGSGVCGG